MLRRNEEKIFINNYIPLAPSNLYMKSKLQDTLSKPSQYFAHAEIKNFDIIYHDLHQKKNGLFFETLPNDFQGKL